MECFITVIEPIAERVSIDHPPRCHLRACTIARPLLLSSPQLESDIRSENSTQLQNANGTRQDGGSQRLK